MTSLANAAQRLENLATCFFVSVLALTYEGEINDEPEQGSHFLTP
jgi:hypothetical protein